MVMRIVLLLSLAWIMRLTEPLFTVLAQAISGRDLILIVGGLFLLVEERRYEIHNTLEGDEDERSVGRGAATFGAVIVQIVIIDIVFSLDSVITAVGMADDVEVMITAIVIAVAVMMLAARPISDFVDRHPTIKMLALSFLMLIGVVLVGRGPRPPHPEGLHLLRDGLLGRGRDAQPAHARRAQAAAAPPGRSGCGRTVRE